jgi:hypothetical protein
LSRESVYCEKLARDGFAIDSILPEKNTYGFSLAHKNNIGDGLVGYFPVKQKVLHKHHLRYYLSRCKVPLLCQVSEARGQRAEGRGQRAEGRGQRAEGRGQRAEGRGQRAEGRGQRAEGGLVA